MTDKSVNIFPLGDSALTVSLGNEISLDLNEKVQKLAAAIEDNPFEGLIEVVPAYCSLSIFYDLLAIRKRFHEFPTAFDAVKTLALGAAGEFSELTETSSRTIKIPVDFGGAFALDLDFVATSNNLSAEEVIEIFVSQCYRVYMLGFLPGFAYMGEVDERIATPRKDSPRTKVPKGSVGIAGRQTGIYPLESPGGWQIIGKTDVELFTPIADSPTYLEPGDLVKFIPI